MRRGWQWPGSGTKWTPESLWSNGTKHRHFNIKIEKVMSASVYTWLTRFCLFGGTASFLCLTLILDSLSIFLQWSWRGLEACSCFAGDNVPPHPSIFEPLFPPLPQTAQWAHRKQQGDLGWTVLSTIHGLRETCPLSSTQFCLNASSFLGSFPL